LHPVRQGEEFGGGSHGLVALFLLTALFLEDLDNTLGGNGEVFILQLLLIEFNYEVVWAELGEGNVLSVAVQELDWDVDTVLGEEGDGFVTGLDLVLHVPDGSALADEVGLAELHGLVVLRAFSLNNVSEVLEAESVLISGAVFLITVVLVLFTVLHHATDGETGGWVDMVASGVELNTLGVLTLHVHVHATEAGSGVLLFLDGLQFLAAASTFAAFG